MAPKGEPTRKTPRRLFSFDSLKSSSTQGSSSEASSIDADTNSSRRHFRAPSQPTLLEQVDESPQEQFPAVGKGWSIYGGSQSNTRSESPNPDKTRSASRLDLRRPLTLAMDKTSISDAGVPRSPSLMRWDHLRQHVVPDATPMVSSHSQQPSSASSSAFSVAPPRSQTPKPSRFAQHLGFRQVVEHAREMVIDDTRKLSQELLRACWAARSADATTKSSKADQYLQFMPTPSVATTAASATAPKPDLRRPSSIQSLALTARAPAAPSLKPIYQLLLHHSLPSADAIMPVPVLPQEPQVLSTLLFPFLNPDKAVRVDEDRWFAFEAFDIIIKTWKPPNETTAMERCKWCCKAALIPYSPLRLRILRALRLMLSPAELAYRATTPSSIQMLATGLFCLLPTISGSGEEHTILGEAIVLLLAGDYGALDVVAVQEQFNALFAAQDTHEAVRQALVLDALARCLENGAESTRRWLLENAFEEYWPRQPEKASFTPLLAAVQACKLVAFTRMALLGLRSKPRHPRHTQFVVHFTQTRVLPELAAMHTMTSVALEARRNVVEIALELLVPGTPRELGLWAMTLFSQWYREVQGEWKTSIDGAVQRIIMERAWPAVLNVLSALLSSIPDDVRKPLCGVLLPSLADRLVDDPPPHPCLPLTDFLEKVSQLYPPVFYKPLFSCAASNKEVAVLNHLSAITAVARFLPDYWTRNAEMTSVALMSGGSTKSPVQSPDALPTWGTARLGQSVLLLELIGRIQAVRRGKEGSSTPDNMYVDIIKFVHALETRLSVLIDVKERTSLVPLSQRMLLMMLFREIRLLTKSLKPAGWLPRMVSWFVESHEETQLNDDSDLELIDAVAQIQGLYTTARDNIGTSRQKKRGTVIMSAAYDGAFNLNSANDTKGGISSVFAEKEQLVLSLAKGFTHKALKLLVAMSTLLAVDDFLRIGPLVWEHHLGGIDPGVVSAASFLVMQCAEKTPHEMEVLMEVDIRSSDDTTRLDAVRRINTLANWRFQIMSQQVIVDRNHRAFKLARGPLAFVATDIGTGQFVRGEDLGDSKDSVPLELRKRLVEIGWVQDEAPVDQHLEWIKTPISNLPVLYLDRLELPGNEQMIASATASPSPAASPNPSHKGSPSLSSSSEKNDEITLLRRNSSSGGPLYGVKRRAIFVSSLALIFPRLATTVFDPNFLIAATARSTIIDLMRNDPALLTRPVLDLFAGPHKNMTTAISTFRAFLHVRRVLPPPLTHHVFNSLTGFLKSHVKSFAGGDDTLYDFALTIPILAKLVTQVSGMSMREIRRAKVEAFLIPSGSLWFAPTAPAGPMFPRHIGQLASLDDIPSNLVHVSMIRLSQNMLFLAMLKRNPQDVQMIRKSMTRLVLPSLQQLPDAPVVEMKDFAPAQANNVNFHPSYLDVNVTNLSMIVSRSYLLLIAQIFRSMSRHLSDRSELGVLIDGLNRILLAHGSDIGIVAHALIALMVASTRFTRLFTSGGGYTLFVPVLIKVYTESEMHNGIRLAIEYAFNRFYALHREAFVFQSVDSMAAVMSLPDIDGPWVAKNVHALFATLTRGISPSTPDAAAISGANKLQEKEALMFSTADEKPQTFLASLKKGGAQDKIKVIVDLPEEYETKRLGLDNLVRLFLTVIAHDPTVMRAQQFLRFLRYIAPILYHASTSSRSVLKEGIDALGVILMRPSAKSKGADANDHLEEPSMESLFAAFPEGQQPNKTKIPSDLLVMRMDYLLLVVNFTRVGGQLSPPASHRAIELVKLMLRDHGNETSVSVSSFVANYTRNSLIRDSANAPTTKAVIGFLADLSPVISSYAMTLDFTGVFDTVAQLCKEPIYANEPLFSRVVVAQICAPALVACEQAASEKLLFSLPSRLALVSLMAQAITLQGADVIAEVERRKPSYEYLAGFILPLALILKTEGQTTSSEVRAEPWHREAHRNTWVRLLAYAMTACQQQVDPSTRDRSKSPDRHRSSTALSKSPVTIFVTALQVIKVVIIRGQEILSACLPGIWSRVALFLKTALEEGSAKFALRAARDLSPSSSPYGSPRSSSQFEHLQPIPNQLSAYFTSSAPGQLLSPRIVDYTLWSFLELLCAFRTPLALQMRLFIQAKVVSLSQEVRQYNGTASPSRRVSTAFSKPRRRSMIPSPEASPGLSPTHSFVNISHASVLSLDTSVGRQAGYYQPSSPHDVRGAGRIVHLGPIAQPEHRSGSPAGGRIRLMAKSTKVRSLVLIQATYRRIRLVQTAMGYDSALLPGAQMPGEDAVPTWTQAQALDAVVQETKELMEEFEQAFWSAANDLVVVDPDQSMSTLYGD